jgi:hypothetical protein
MSSVATKATKANHTHGGTWKSTKRSSASAVAARTSELTGYAVEDASLPITAWAAANRAIGTRNGEHET